MMQNSSSPSRLLLQHTKLSTVFHNGINKTEVYLQAMQPKQEAGKQVSARARLSMKSQTRARCQSFAAQIILLHLVLRTTPTVWLAGLSHRTCANYYWYIVLPLSFSLIWGLIIVDEVS
jgi:hypothetical protein